MMQSSAIPATDAAACEPTKKRFKTLLTLATQTNNRQVDRFFIWMMVLQYVAGIAATLLVSPHTWIADTPYLHLHVWLAIVFGALISGFPIYMAWRHPGSIATMHVMAVAQAVWGALLIHLTGGRLETHFHVFCSLAFISFYRDWRPIVTMTIVVAADHAFRGMVWPLSVYGVATESPWRWTEHAAWVILEDVVLVLSCLRGRREIQQICMKQAELETLNEVIEGKVQERTKDLSIAREQAERLAMVAKHTDNAVLVLDPTGHIIWFNEGFVRNTGYTLDEVEGKRPIDFLRGPSTRESDVQRMLDEIAAGRQFDLVITKHRKDGTPMILEIEGRPILSESGQVIQYFQIERDITERRQAEAERARLSQELAESADHLAKLALVARSTSNAVLIADKSGNIEWTNPEFSRMLGYSPGEVHGKSPSEILTGPKTPKSTIDAMVASLNDNGLFAGDLVVYRKDGEELWVTAQISPARNDVREVVRLIFVITDITERKRGEKERDRLQQELQEAARVAGRADVAAGVLHNLGNVLNSVGVSATLVREQLTNSVVNQLRKGTELLNEHRDDLPNFLTEDEQGKNFPRFVSQVSDSLVKEKESELAEIESLIGSVELIRGIVASQNEIADQRHVLQPVDIRESIESALDAVKTGMIENDIQIECRLDAVLSIKSDQHALMQILLTLLKNAQDACALVDGERTVTVKSHRERDQLCIEVTDSGVGIASESLNSIFQPEFLSKSAGIGIGLHFAAITATELGGAITASSAGLGEGATFTLTLPLDPQDATSLSVESETLAHCEELN